jgi:8-oxo-dGTP diphosphatase
MKMEKTPVPNADIIIEKEGRIVLIKRLKDPFKGMLALPGGKMDYGETIEDAAIREALEETSIKVRLKGIMGVYSEPGRDPRYHAMSIVFVAEPEEGELKAGSDAAEAVWMDVSEIDTARMSFDHGKVIEDYRKWKEKGETFWSRR